MDEEPEQASASAVSGALRRWLHWRKPQREGERHRHRRRVELAAASGQRLGQPATRSGPRRRAREALRGRRPGPHFAFHVGSWQRYSRDFRDEMVDGPPANTLRVEHQEWNMRSRRVHAALAALLVVTPFVGEGGEGIVPDGVVGLRDTGIAMSAVSDRGDSTVCSLADTPDVRVASPASGEWVLFRISDIGRMEDGRLVVLNRSSQELLMFDRGGSYLRSIGRQGEGPGEFMDPIELDFVGGDSIIVWDWELGRTVLFGPDGSHERSVRLQPPVPYPTGRMGVMGWRGIAIGSHDVRTFETKLTAQFLQVLLYDWSGTLIDTLATLPYGELGMIDPESRWMGRPLFEPKGVFSTRSDLLYTSDGSSPEVWIRRGGQHKSIVRWDPGNLSVRDEDVEAYRAAWLERTGRALAAFPAKDAFPAVTEIRIDAEGRVWIQTFPRPGATNTVWLGFAETGAFICSLSVPRSFRIHHFDSTTVVGVHRDQMDVESVEVRAFHFPIGDPAALR